MVTLIKRGKKIKGSDTRGSHFGIQNDRVFLAIVAALIGCIYFINRYIQKQNEKRLELPGISIGKSIDSFNLIGEDRTIIDKSTLQNSIISVIFIFSQPCPVCEHNIFFWNKLIFSLNKEPPVFGIVLAALDIEEIVNSLESKKLKFKTFVPADKDKFSDLFNVKFNLAQTVLIQNGKVIYRKTGDIDTSDYFRIKKIIEGGIKK